MLMFSSVASWAAWALRRRAIGDEQDSIVHLLRVPRRGLAAAVRERAGDDERVDAAPLQRFAKRARAGNECAEAPFLDDQIFRADVELRPERGVVRGGREAFAHAARGPAGRQLSVEHRTTHAATPARSIMRRNTLSPPCARTARLMRLTRPTISRAAGTSTGRPAP